MLGAGRFAVSCPSFQDHEGRGSRGGCELHLHPEGLEVLLLLPGGQTQLLRILVLLTGGKSMVLETEDKQALEMLDGGRVDAALPLLKGLLAEAKEPAQFSLGQVHVLAQPRTGAPENVFPFVLIGFFVLCHLLSLPLLK